MSEDRDADAHAYLFCSLWHGDQQLDEDTEERHEDCEGDREDLGY